MSDRSYLSIGEVLSLLTAEFPDVTISKIRFLESQGLIDPERTPSGYRKFYEHDVERLKWILRQQRENFLPLKVIRGRLGDEPEGAADTAAAEAESKQTHPTNAGPSIAEAASAVTTEAPAVRPPLHPVEEPTPITKVRRSPVSASPTAELKPAATPRPAPTPEPEPDHDAHEVALTVEELAAATGLSEARVLELAKFGLIAPRTLGGTDYFDADALAVTQAAAGFLQFGIEARHLKQFKSAADREAGLFEQIVLPLLKQRNPAARRQAAESLEQLGRLGEGLRAALVRQAVRDITG
ncbi:MAG TPA: MerR family transcriptional regulator [Acidimicrobiales bacterium]|nr:MerR family transcriptional regulator [Acidimicrobiales bacterium]